MRCSSALRCYIRRRRGIVRLELGLGGIRSAKIPAAPPRALSLFSHPATPTDCSRAHSFPKWVIEMMLENDLTEINTLQSTFNTSSCHRSVSVLQLNALTRWLPFFSIYIRMMCWMLRPYAPTDHPLNLEYVMREVFVRYSTLFHISLMLPLRSLRHHFPTVWKAQKKSVSLPS